MVAQWEGLPDSEAYWRGLSEQPKQQAFDAVLQAARWPNVALKWAHAPAHFAAGGYPNLAARPFLRKALDASPQIVRMGIRDARKGTFDVLLRMRY